MTLIAAILATIAHVFAAIWTALRSVVLGVFHTVTGTGPLAVVTLTAVLLTVSLVVVGVGVRRNVRRGR